MTGHSIDELKRQLDQAQARYEAARSALWERQREYHAAMCAEYQRVLEKAGFVFGTNIVEYRRRGWSEVKRTRAIPMRVVWKYGRPMLVLQHLRADGSVGKRQDVLSVGVSSTDDLKLSEITFLDKTKE